MWKQLSKEWIFIVDTDKYAGNFERELCAYVCGQIGDCGVGNDEQELFENEVENDPFSFVICRSDRGCNRPCSIWNSPNGPCNSVAIFMEINPNAEHFSMLKDRANKFCERKGIKILGFRLLVECTKQKQVWSQSP